MVSDKAVRRLRAKSVVRVFLQIIVALIGRLGLLARLYNGVKCRLTKPRTVSAGVTAFLNFRFMQWAQKFLAG